MNEITKIFISSRFEELKVERVLAADAVKETGRELRKKIEPVCIDRHATPPSTSIRDYCLTNILECQALVLILHKTISQIIKEEFRVANKCGMPIFIFQKKLNNGDRIDKELQAFIEKELSPIFDGFKEKDVYDIYCWKEFDFINFKTEINDSIKDYYPYFSLAKIPKEYLPYIQEPEKLSRTKTVYVKPSCYEEAKKKLEDGKVLIITGPAHLGKTSLAFHMAYMLTETHTARRFLAFPRNGKLSDLINVKNSIILFDDPFGETRFESVPSGLDIDQLLYLGRSNYVILTSRREVLTEAEEKSKFGEKRWLRKHIIEMKASDYNYEDLKAILRKHLNYSRDTVFKDSRIFGKILRLAKQNEDMITSQLQFPHNYELLVTEHLPAVTKGEKTLQEALDDAKYIESAVGLWFSNYYKTDKEVFYFLLTIAVLAEQEEEETFFHVYKDSVEKIREKRGLNISVPMLADLSRLRKITASYVSQSGWIRFEHPSYKEGIWKEIIDKYADDAVVIIRGVGKGKIWRVRQSATSSLIIVGKSFPQKVLPILNELKYHVNDEIRRDAAWVAGELVATHPQKVLPVLKELTNDENPSVRYSAAQGMRRVAQTLPKEVFPILKELVNDGVPEVCNVAARVLGGLGEAQSEEVLNIVKELSIDKRPLVRWAAVISLGGMEAKLFYDETPPLLKNKVLHDEVLSLLKNLVNDDDIRVRSAAAEALYFFDGLISHTHYALIILKQFSKDEDLQIRSLGANILGSLAKNAPKELIPTIWEWLTDNDAGVRSAASCALGFVTVTHPKESLLTLKQLTKNKDSELRSIAAWNLGWIDESLFEETLPIFLQLSKDEEPSVRWAATVAFRSKIVTYTEQLLPIFTNLAKDKNSEVSKEASWALRFAKSDCRK